MTFDPNDEDLEQFRFERHQQCISQPWVAALPGALPPAPAATDLNGFLAPLLATVTRQVDAQEVHNNILHTQVEYMVEKNEKNRVKHLHESVIKMLLYASAMDNESVPTELTESCKRIINSKTVALAEQELNLQFESRGLNMVSFLTGYTSNMYNGMLLWSSMDTPSNHSPFTFSEAEPIRMSEQMNPQVTVLKEERVASARQIENLKNQLYQLVRRRVGCRGGGRSLNIASVSFASSLFLSPPPSLSLSVSRRKQKFEVEETTSDKVDQDDMERENDELRGMLDRAAAAAEAAREGNNSGGGIGPNCPSRRGRSCGGGCPSSSARTPR